MSDGSFGEHVEVEQQGIAGFRALRGELLQKEVMLEHLAQWIEILLPRLPCRRIDLGGVERSLFFVGLGEDGSGLLAVGVTGLEPVTSRV